MPPAHRATQLQLVAILTRGPAAHFCAQKHLNDTSASKVVVRGDDGQVHFEDCRFCQRCGCFHKESAFEGSTKTCKLRSEHDKVGLGKRGFQCMLWGMQTDRCMAPNPRPAARCMRFTLRLCGRAFGLDQKEAFICPCSQSSGRRELTRLGCQRSSSRCVPHSPCGHRSSCSAGPKGWKTSPPAALWVPGWQLV